LEFQPSDLGLGGQRILRHRANDPLQRGQIVGQIVGCDRHAGTSRSSLIRPAAVLVND
jgi:hypothetical protein